MVLWCLFYFIVKCTWHKFYHFSHLLNHLFSGIKYIHFIVQLSPLSVSKTWSSSQAEPLYPIKNNIPHASLPTAPSNHYSTFCLWVWLFYVPHVSGMVQYLSFCVWLISLSIMSLRFVYTIACARIPFLFKAEQYFIVCIHHIWFIHSSVSWFSAFGVKNIAAMNMSVQIPVFVPAFIFSFSFFFDIYSELLGHMVILLKFLKNFHTEFSLVHFWRKYMHHWYLNLIQYKKEWMYTLLSLMNVGIKILSKILANNPLPHETNTLWASGINSENTKLIEY